MKFIGLMQIVLDLFLLWVKKIRFPKLIREASDLIRRWANGLPFPGDGVQRYAIGYLPDGTCVGEVPVTWCYCDHPESEDD